MTTTVHTLVDFFAEGGVFYARRSDDALFRLDRVDGMKAGALVWCELPPVPGTERTEEAREAEGFPRAE